MDDSLPRPESVAVREGVILKVGPLAEVMTHRGDATNVFDLKGRALLPGFVDSHGHVVMGGLQALSANLLAPPDGAVRDIAGIQETLKAWAEDNAETVQAVNLIVGFGYDQSQLEEKRPPNRDDLDAVSADVPIIIVHQSGHFGVANSRASYGGAPMANRTACSRRTRFSRRWWACLATWARTASKRSRKQVRSCGRASATPRRKRADPCPARWRS
jgi:predicted amidohydrolase YtcJ